MKPLRVVLVRHGESTANLEPQRIAGAPDFPLTEKGELAGGAMQIISGHCRAGVPM